MQIQNFRAPLTAEQITRSLEAYLMWLFGKVMFTENHVSTISTLYIPMALEIASAQTADHIRQRELGFGGLSGYIPRYVQRLPAYIEKASPSWMPSIPTAVVVGEVLYRATRCTCS